VREPDSERKEALRRLVVVEVLRRVAEREEIAADVEVPRSVRARNLADRHGEQHADVKEAELVVFTGHRVLVVVVQAEGNLHWNRNRSFLPEAPARTRETELEVRPLVRTAVSAT